MSATRALAVGLLCAGALSGLPGAAAADRLVLRDGQTIETRGAVKLDSRRAVYTDLTGRLVALRIEEVDVARTTAPPAPSPAAAAAKPRPPVLRLTDADVGHPGDPSADVEPLVHPPAESAHLAAATADTQDASAFAPAPAAETATDTAPAPVVTLYSTTWCGWCRKSRGLMQSLGIAFVERDVEADARAAVEKARLAPGFGVPVLVRGGEIQRGFNEATIRSWAPAGKS